MRWGTGDRNPAGRIMLLPPGTNDKSARQTTLDGQRRSSGGGHYEVEIILLMHDRNELSG